MLRVGYLILQGIILSVLLMPNTCVQRTARAPAEQTPHSPAADANPVAEKIIPVTDSLVSFSAVSESARSALIISCGRCHQSTLDSHKPGAIAIFDLDQGAQWHAGLNREQLSGLDRRAKGNTSLNEEQRNLIAEFVALKRTHLPE
jgi:hypothetical protein